MQISDELLRSISARIQQFGVGNLRILSTKTISPNSEVSVYRIETPNGFSGIAAKQTRLNTPAGAQSLSHEYRALQELNTILGEELAKSIPRPLLLWEAEGTMLLSLVSGVPFQVLLRRYGNVFCGCLSVLTLPRMRRCSRHIGEWLRAFHDVTRGKDTKHDHEPYVLEVTALISSCKERLPELRVEHAFAEVVGLSYSLSGMPVPASGVHGDFLPQNILIHEDKLGIIDFAAYRRQGPRYIDLAHFVAYLTILAAKRIYSTAVMESVAKFFFLGYSLPLSSDMLKLYMFRAVLRIISDGSPRQTFLPADTINRLLSRILTDDFFSCI